MEEIENKYLGQPNIVKFGPENWFLPERYSDYAQKILDFKARPDDVFICTFPRSGTTWTQEMIWLICNDLDYETALSTKCYVKFPCLELHLLTEGYASQLPDEEDRKFGAPIYDYLEEQTTRRFIKTHLPFSLMPRNIKEVGAKVVYVARNPKDVIVSYYYFAKAFPGFKYSGDFESFLDLFLDDMVFYGPYWKHVLSGWNNRDADNVHFMFYEDSKLDLKNSLKNLSMFLEKSLKDEDLPKLMDHLTVDSFKKNTKINIRLDETKIDGEIPEEEFVRRGLVGGNPEITGEMSMRIDEWTKKNLENSDLKFPLVLKN